MSKFSRAFDGALTTAGVSQAEAARISGLHTSTLSRIMSDEISASPEHVEKMLVALSNESDRLHCLREYIFDQTPSEYRDRLVVHFGTLNEAHAQRPRDSLTIALENLEESATSDADLRHLLTDLAKVVRKPTREPSTEEQAIRAASAEMVGQFVTSPQNKGEPKAPLEPTPSPRGKSDGRKR